MKSYRSVLHRLILAILAGVTLAGGVLWATARPAYAVQSAFESATSDCGSIDIWTVLVYARDDLPDDPAQRDVFLLRIYDGSDDRLIAELQHSVSRTESPYYWNTGRIPAQPQQGLYRIEVWDIDEWGMNPRLVEKINFQCVTGASWRADGTVAVDPALPQIACTAYAPIYATNAAPDNGMVIAVWSYGRRPEDQHYFVRTIRVRAGERLRNLRIEAPCGVYLKLYYQPGPAGGPMYFLESQYSPGEVYGMPSYDGAVGASYHTTFPRLPAPTVTPRP
ncbi:MAG: hypothetical protein IT326_06665 [Anaerolineae bacterium]|nr:hypothetical protein [Anaerolineae bacterium]